MRINFKHVWIIYVIKKKMVLVLVIVMALDVVIVCCSSRLKPRSVAGLVRVSNYVLVYYVLGF